MEYVTPPVLLVLVLRFAFPALITWFFERFVEPRAEKARQTSSSKPFAQTEVSNAQKIELARNGLDELKRRLGRTEQ